MIAILPVKPFASAKSRLADMLSAKEREDFASALFHHTLDIVQSCCTVDKIEVVTPDREVAKIALSRRCNVVMETRTRGLNPALEEGLSTIRANEDTRILILPTDLPNLSCDDIAALSVDNSPAIAPDSLDQGTNGLFFSMRDRPMFCFGEDSAAKHRNAFGKMVASPVRLVRRPGLSFDLDTPDDLHKLRSAPCNGPLGAFFHHLAEAA